MGIVTCVCKMYSEMDILKFYINKLSITVISYTFKFPNMLKPLLT